MNENPLAPLKNQILAGFSCHKSGNCCRAPGFVYVTAADISKMAAHLGLAEAAFREGYVRRHKGWEVIAAPDFRPNCFLDEENRCSVYEHRPVACRTYPHWPEIWASEEAVQEEVARCPGLKAAVAKLQKDKH